MRKLLAVSIFLLLTTFFSNSFIMAQDSSDSNEISINQLYRDMTRITFPAAEEFEKGKEFEKMDVAMDYTVEILKRNPASLEAYCALSHIRAGIKYNQAAINKYKLLKEKYLNFLNDPDTDPAEKLVFMAILYNDDPGVASDNLLEKNHQISVEGLKKMKDECKNKNYAALATLVLFSERNKNLHCFEFIEKFPTHVAVPIVKLSIATGYIFIEKDYDKCIAEVNKLQDQYKNYDVPDGWKFSVPCYEILALAYIAKKDHDNTLKYYNLIIEKAPNYPNLSMIKFQLDGGKESLLKEIREKNKQ